MTKQTDIDIIIPYVNHKDKNWIDTYNKYAKTERGQTGIERFRDVGTLKYALRSIEKNCSWCRYVFLVLSSPSQIPPWLNLKNEKLKIVYHADYIPEEFLPTFNSNVIEMFYPNIKELAEHFIIFNDDFIVTKKLSSDYFFIDDKPVSFIKVFSNSFWNVKNDPFVTTINNNMNLIKEICGSIIHFQHPHNPQGVLKSFWQFILQKFYDKIYKSLIVSKFRHERNYTWWLIDDLQKVASICKARTTNATKVYTTNDLCFTDVLKYDTICYNDTPTKRFNESVNNFTKFMEEIFNFKSNFEV